MCLWRIDSALRGIAVSVRWWPSAGWVTCTDNRADVHSRDVGTKWGCARRMNEPGGKLSPAATQYGGYVVLGRAQCVVYVFQINGT